MKMPTIHCMENGKILCGKKKGIYMDIKIFKQELENDSAALVLGGCSKCEAIVKAKKE